jgi:uncharacterized protein Yka (UPF0111/DUF47 family)
VRLGKYVPMETEAERYEITGDAREFLGRLGDCVGTVPDVFEGYDGDVTREVERVSEAESDCDVLVDRMKRNVVGSVSPTVGLYIRSESVVRLLRELDVVANRAEETVRVARVTRPEMSERVRRNLTEMAERSAVATGVLSDCVVRTFESFEEPGRVDISEEAERIRETERRCDRLKYETLETAFDELPSEEAVVVKEIASTLDGVPDAVEDAADILVYLTDG